jgi:hypothetical protein|tara:strand:+ start:44125 stop:44322 length:198 start_codon:yes stop_codon:yes gene_type:complete
MFNEPEFQRSLIISPERIPFLKIAINLKTTSSAEANRFRFNQACKERVFGCLNFGSFGAQTRGFG